EPVVERPFVPVPPKELSVYDEQHPRPKDAVGAEALRGYLTETSDQQLAALLPKDAQGLREFRRVIGTALRVMIHDRLPNAPDAQGGVGGPVGGAELDGAGVKKVLLSRASEGEQVPAVVVTPPEPIGLVVVWVHPEGKKSLLQDGKLAPAARQLLDAKATVVA